MNSELKYLLIGFVSLFALLFAKTVFDSYLDFKETEAAMKNGYSQVKESNYYKPLWKKPSQIKEIITNKPMENKNLTFGAAIEALKQGKRVCREGWNGKGMFLFLLPAGKVPKTAIHDPALRAVMDEQIEGDTFDALGSIRMFTADKKVLTGWLASQTDMLSEDWTILE